MKIINNRAASWCKCPILWDPSSSRWEWLILHFVERTINDVVPCIYNPRFNIKHANNSLKKLMNNSVDKYKQATVWDKKNALLLIIITIK